MAVQAILHHPGLLVVHQRHFLYRAMAGTATDTLVYVNAVIEVHVIGHVVRACPDERLPRPETLAYRFQHRLVAPYLRMTVHASLSWRDTRKARHLD